MWDGLTLRKALDCVVPADGRPMDLLAFPPFRQPDGIFCEAYAPLTFSTALNFALWRLKSVASPQA